MSCQRCRNESELNRAPPLLRQFCYFILSLFISESRAFFFLYFWNNIKKHRSEAGNWKFAWPIIRNNFTSLGPPLAFPTSSYYSIIIQKLKGKTLIDCYVFSEVLRATIYMQYFHRLHIPYFVRDIKICLTANMCTTTFPIV